jgi:hypothetical protein
MACRARNYAGTDVGVSRTGVVSNVVACCLVQPCRLFCERSVHPMLACIIMC